MSGHWSAADVPTMWASARYGDTEAGWNQVLGWQTLYELLDQRQMLLQQSRNELAASWPPERSSAASAFMEYLDGLLTSMDQAKRDAVFNQYALTDVLRSLANSRIELEKLNDQWVANEQEEAGSRASLMEYTPMAGGDPDWREKLNAKGRAIMNQTDLDVLAAKGAMSVPIPFPIPSSNYAASKPLVDGQADSGNSSDTSSNSFSLIRVGSTGSGSLGVSSGDATAGADLPPGHNLGALGSGADLGLSGSQAGVSAQDGGEGVKRMPPLGDRQGVNGGALGLVVGIGAGALGAVGYGRALPEVGSAKGMRAIGGVDGFHSPLSAYALVDSGESSPMRPRINPVGGVIGSGGEPTGHGSGMMPMGGRSRRRDCSSGERVAYEEWTALRGVPPVLEPGPEVRHDPGPGIIGIDR